MMVALPVPNRVVLNAAAKNFQQVLRDAARLVAEETHLHPVGVQDYFSDATLGVIESQVVPGVTLFDGRLVGIESPCLIVMRLAAPVMAGGDPRVATRVFVFLLSSESEQARHVQRVNRVARFLKARGTMAAIEQADRPEEVTALFLIGAQGRAAA